MLGNFNSSYKSADASPMKYSEISPKDFEEWSSSNMYRSSYRDMYKKTPVKSKNYAIPGYTGHIPGTIADTNYGKRFAVVTKEQFTREKYLPKRYTENFPQRPVSLSSMEKTYSKFGGGLEDEYHTISRFHGKSTIPTTHPNYTTTEWTTNYREGYKNQEPLRVNLFRKTDPGFFKKTQVSKRNSTKASGFVQNSTLFDGHGWVPISKLHGDMTYSEYRNRFNPDVNFHPNPIGTNVRKLPRKQLVY
jgi:hypothetical protein